MKAQITLEHSYNYAVSVVNLSVSGYKYSALDATTQEVKLFNLNHSLWKTITLNIPSGYTLQSTNFISEKLFNLDNNVELLYTYYQTSPSTSYVSKIISETGAVLLTMPNVYNNFVSSTGTNGTKRSPQN